MFVLQLLGISYSCYNNPFITNCEILILLSLFIHGFSTQKMCWEKRFTLVNMNSCVMPNVRKHRDINNGDQYIILEISSNIDLKIMDQE